MTDEEKRAGHQARKELTETEVSFEAVKLALIEKLYTVTTPDQAFRCAMQLQSLDAVRRDLMGKAASVELAQYDEERAK